jgi:hypothetical protein
MRVAAFLSMLAVAAAADVPAPPPDPDIARMISEVSAERIQRSIVVLASSRTRHTLSDPRPSGDGIGSAAAWIRAEFERVSAATGKRLKVEVDDFRQEALPPLLPRAVTIANIAATLPGSRQGAAGRTFVLCCHYDTRLADPLDAAGAAPGADDDASGVALVLELARVMARHDFGSTIVFLAVAGNGQGLLGSRRWAVDARKKGIDIAGVLDADVVGSVHGENGATDRGSVRLFAPSLPPVGDLPAALRRGGENDTPARELARAVRDDARRYVPSLAVRLVFRPNPLSGGGDHLAFPEQGYPAVRFSESAADPRRRYAKDTVDAVDFSYVADVAKANLAALADLARAPAPPEDVTVAAGPEGDAVLSWRAGTDPDVAGYRVVWRDSATLLWEHAVDAPAGAAGARVRGASADDAIFGVEAFDSAGHASPAAFAAGP